MCSLAAPGLVSGPAKSESTSPSSSVPVKKPTAFIVDFSDQNPSGAKNTSDNLQEAFLKYRNYKMVTLVHRIWSESLH